MKKTKELYTISFRCKRYVQRYLMLHYGCPIKDHPYLCDIRKDKELGRFLKRAVKNPCTTRDKFLSSIEGKKRNCCVEFIISEDMFVRYGWSLSKTDEYSLHSCLESRCLSILIPFLTLQMMIRHNLKVAIEEFYDSTGFSDASWPATSIVKIWQRKRSKLDLDCMESEINAFLTKILMCKLSDRIDNVHPDFSHD